MQFMLCLKGAWKQEGLWLKPYHILVTSSDSALIGFLTDTISISALKKYLLTQNLNTLRQFYEWYYGPCFLEAQQNFCKSLAGYSVLCYLMKVKDRHNGNIMLSRQGHVIHIDFGFMFQSAPGKDKLFGFTPERAPFKLTQEYVELLDGEQSALFTQFRQLVCKGLLAAQKC